MDFTHVNARNSASGEEADRAGVEAMVAQKDDIFGEALSWGCNSRNFDELLTERLQGLYREVLDEPVPQRLLDAIERAPLPSFAQAVSGRR
jgi:anti-sigma factor RsiW